MRTVYYSAIVLVLLILVTPLSAFAQDDTGPAIVENSSGNFFGIGARGLGMGGAQIAAGMDGTALVYNPAALARIRRIEVLAGLSHEKYSNDQNTYPDGVTVDPTLDGVSRSHTRLNTLNIVVPAPTYRGSAVVAFGINRVTSFDHAFQFARILVDGDSGGSRDRGTEIETGSLYLYSAGGAIDISPRVSVGLSLNLYNGKDNYTWDYQRMAIDGERYTQFVDADYTGVSAKVGMIATPNQNTSIGVVVESPIKFQIDGVTSDLPYYYEYELKHPFTFGGGVSTRFRGVQFAADLHYTDWTQMEYTEHEFYALENRLIGRYYRDVLRLNLGAEYLVQHIGAKVRVGYMYDPLPYADFLINNDRDFVTFGVGFLIDRVMTIDIAFVHGSYEYAQPAPDSDGFQDISNSLFEKYTLNRVYVTTAFRL